MTESEAKSKGYELVLASAFEWGLTRHGVGIRTWWASQLGMRPTLENQKVQEAIEVNEQMEGEKR